MRVKLVAKGVIVVRSILLVRSKAMTRRSAHMEQLPSRYPNPFMHEIEGMKPPKKFTHNP